MLLGEQVCLQELFEGIKGLTCSDRFVEVVPPVGIKVGG